MASVLVLGGTVFVGRHIVRALAAAGHRVTVFHRGVTPGDDLPVAARLHGDRDLGDAGLAALDGGPGWDACIDVSGYRPEAVRASAQRLVGHVGCYVYVSAVMTYGAPPHGPVDESFPVVDPAPAGTAEIDGRTYGPLKVACERVVHAVYGPRATVLRPQVIVGPGDGWPRYTEWARRALRSQRGEPFAAPGDGRTMLQVIDVRDVARFVATVVERRAAGIYNLAGPRIDWLTFVGLLGARNVRWTPVPVDDIDLDTWPLYRPPGHPLAALMHIDASRAQAAGLVLTDPAVTARDVLASLESSA